LSKKSWWEKNRNWFGFGVILAVMTTVFFARDEIKSLSQEPTEIQEPTETHSPTSEPEIGSIQTSLIDGMVLAYIPEGEYVMGRDGGDIDEGPAHPVYLDEFWMDQTEVTFSQFQKFMEDSNYSASPCGKGSQNPVACVNWNDANAYCEWAERRLPTEAEWEKAARGGLEKKRYPWGDEEPVCTVGAENGEQGYGCPLRRTVKVMTFSPNGYGLYDMTGNVWEWVADWYSKDYYNQTPIENPQGPETGNLRATRGGSWGAASSQDNSSTVYRRSNYFPTISSEDLGFRCVSDTPTSTVSPLPSLAPLPSLTSIPAEIPLPEGAEELVSRLGEEARVVLDEGEKYMLFYDGRVIGELDEEKQMSFLIKEETITLGIESLEVRDGNLISIDRQRTEEMGVDWVEQVWISKRGRITVPEPMILLPETYEETIVVNALGLDYFMPKLVAAEKKYLDKNKWINERNHAYLDFPRPDYRLGLPYVERWSNVYGGANGEDVVLSSWTRIQMPFGKELDLVGVPLVAMGHSFGSFQGENYIWHYVYDCKAAKNWGLRRRSATESQNLEFENRIRPEYIFEIFKKGYKEFQAIMFIDAREVEGWEEEYDWTEQYIRIMMQRGFDDIDILMKRLIENVPNHGEALGKLMIDNGQSEPIQVPYGFMENMEEQLLPALLLQVPYYDIFGYPQK